MKEKSTIKDITESILKIEKQEINSILFLEKIRENLIEKIRLNKISMNYESISSYKNELKENISYNNFDIEIKILSFKDKFDEEKFKSKSDFLEIAISGKKYFKIYDKNNQKTYLSYKLFPNYGIIYSKDTFISNSTFPKTSIISININNIKKKLLKVDK